MGNKSYSCNYYEYTSGESLINALNENVQYDLLILDSVSVSGQPVCHSPFLRDCWNFLVQDLPSLHNKLYYIPSVSDSLSVLQAIFLAASLPFWICITVFSTYFAPFAASGSRESFWCFTPMPVHTFSVHFLLSFTVLLILA